MPTIEIDEEVFRFLEQNARPFVESDPNAVLRRLLLNNPIVAERAKSMADEKPSKILDTDAFVRRVLTERFGSLFRRSRTYRYIAGISGDRTGFNITIGRGRCASPQSPQTAQMP